MTFALAPGVVVAQRYRLTHWLGEGGMGVVWAATHTHTRRNVAIKLPRDSVRPEMQRRFLREARAVTAVDHPNIIRVHDAFELEDGRPVLVMDLLEGETFGKLLEREQTLSVAEACRILLPVVSAVGTAHAFGIVHRDLKPENVFLAKIGKETVVKVLDFGIAKLESTDGTTTATTTGSTLGTPCYMAPEQMLAEKDIDHRVDVWAIGVMLYEALSGGRPVEGENIGQVVKHLLTDVITPIGAAVPNLPADIESLVNRMLARNAGDRLADLREAMDVLARHSDVRVPAFGAPRSQVGSTGFAPASDIISKNVDTGDDAPRPRRRALLALGLGATAMLTWAVVATTRREPVTFASTPDIPRAVSAPAPVDSQPSPTNAEIPSSEPPVVLSAAASTAPPHKASKRKDTPATSAQAPVQPSPVSSAPTATNAAPSASSRPKRRGLAEDVPF
jgi:serine/threonine-protein kinase